MALGCIGLSYDDFCGLTPSCFDAVYKAYTEKLEDAERIAWSRMRLQTCISIQPHIRKRLSPAELIKFPWEAEDAKEDVSKEDALKRFTKLVKANTTTAHGRSTLHNNTHK